VTLSDPTAARPTFLSPPVGIDSTRLEFELVVTDKSGLQDSGAVDVEVKDNGITGYGGDVFPVRCDTGERLGMRMESGGDMVSFNPVSVDSVGTTEDMPQNMVYGLIDMQLKPETKGGTV
jgi:hypothetical protein